MAELKIVVSNPKTGKSFQKVLPENPFINLKVRDKIQGDEIGLEGYELEIRGGSDISGCPIRADLPGIGKKQVLLTKGPCIKIPRGNKGVRFKKTVVANTITTQIVQLNTKVIKEGSKSIEEAWNIQPKEQKAEETKPVEKAAV